MPETRDLVVRIKIDADPFARAMHDAGTVMRNMAADFAGKPRPPRKPYPKTCSGMTARQYRAARRKWNRECRAYKSAMRTWSQPSIAERWAAAAPLFAAVANSRGQGPSGGDS